MGCAESSVDTGEKAPKSPAAKTATATPAATAPAAAASAAPAAPATSAAPAAAASAGTETEPKPTPENTQPTETVVVTAQKEVDEDADTYGLLLCGAGESGKTTFSRQLKLNYIGEFSSSEREVFKGTIRGNVIEAIQILLSWCRKQDIDIDSDNDEHADAIVGLDPFNTEYTMEIVDHIRALWDDSAIKEAFEHRDETTLPDHMDYFLDKCEALADDAYIPNNDDILRARIRSIGVEKTTLNLNGALTTIFDVGGQKMERSKWDKVEESTEGCIFVVSLSEFDKPMFESPEIIRINDSIDLFRSIVRRPKFQNAPIFLIGNKYDLFEEKIRSTDAFAKIYPDYDGDIHDPEACSKFLIDKFLECANPPKPEQPINVYKISALDSKQVLDTTTKICQFISKTYFED